MTRSLVCCCAQIGSCWENPERTLEKAENMVEQASRQDAALIAFPEQFTTGWDPSSVLHAETTDGPIVQRFRHLAVEYGISLLGSFREQKKGSLRNTAIAIDQKGRILTTYSKIHPFSPLQENVLYHPGEKAGIFTLDGVSFGIAICYDLRFPSLFRIYASRNVDCVLVPAAWPASRKSHWKIFIEGRALDNLMYIAGINTTGTTPVDSYNGGSMAADPDGVILFEANDQEGVFPFDIDPEKVASKRKETRIFLDRRSDLYHRIFRNKYEIPME